MMPLPEHKQSAPNDPSFAPPSAVSADRRQQVLAEMLAEALRLQARRRARRTAAVVLAAGATALAVAFVVLPALVPPPIPITTPQAPIPGPSVVTQAKPDSTIVQFLPAVGAPPTLLTGNPDMAFLETRGVGEVQYVDDQGLVTALAAYGIRVAVVRTEGAIRVLSRDPRMSLPPGIDGWNPDVR